MATCKNCGEELAADSVYCPNCGKRAKSAHKCSHCHVELPEHSRFCYRCGCKVSVSIFVQGNGKNAPKIWVWQPTGKECSKEMGFTWENRPQMQMTEEMGGCYRFDVDADCYKDSATFAFILNEASPVYTDMTKSFCYDGKHWWGI